MFTQRREDAKGCTEKQVVKAEHGLNLAWRLNRGLNVKRDRDKKIVAPSRLCVKFCLNRNSAAQVSE